jgi:hypothetical protein
LFSFSRSLSLYTEVPAWTSLSKSLLLSAARFWSYLQIPGTDCVRNLSFRTISSSCDSGWYAFIRHP